MQRGAQVTDDPRHFMHLVRATSFDAVTSVHAVRMYIWDLLLERRFEARVTTRVSLHSRPFGLPPYSSVPWV